MNLFIQNPSQKPSVLFGLSFELPVCFLKSWGNAHTKRSYVRAHHWRIPLELTLPPRVELKIRVVPLAAYLSHRETALVGMSKGKVKQRRDIGSAARENSESLRNECALVESLTRDQFLLFYVFTSSCQHRILL